MEEFLKNASDTHDKFLPTFKDKVIFWTGAVCAVAALIMVSFVEPAKFSVPVWLISAIFAAIALVSLIFHQITPPSQVAGGVNQACVDMVRDKALVFFVLFATIATIFKFNSKYVHYSMDMCVEIILVAVVTLCWSASRF